MSLVSAAHTALHCPPLFLFPNSNLFSGKTMPLSDFVDYGRLYHPWPRDKGYDTA